MTIDFDCENENSENSGLSPTKSHQKINLDETEVIFSDPNATNSLEDDLPNESQPLLGGDHHETHQIIYNQFPSKFSIQLRDTKRRKLSLQGMKRISSKRIC